MFWGMEYECKEGSVEKVEGKAYERLAVRNDLGLSDLEYHQI